MTDDVRGNGAVERPARRLVAACLPWVVLVLVVAGCGDKKGGESARGERAFAPGPVFLLGFDGIDPRLVGQFEAEGILPNFSRLRGEGAVGIVRSTLPMISPPAWVTVSTGVPPSMHGIWSFWIPEAGNPRGRYVDASHRLAPAIWQDLSAAGHTVGVVNVPISSPPDSVRGFLIGGFPYPPGSPLTWPPELEAEIVTAGYQRDAFLGPPGRGQELAWLERMTEVGRARREIGLELLFDRRPDLSFIVFTLPDRIQHHLWKFRDPANPHYRSGAPEPLRAAVRDIYVWCDEILGEVLANLRPETTLFVLSDHGFGPSRLGVSKEKLSRLVPAALRHLRPEGRNLFGGDFYLGQSSSPEERQSLAEFFVGVGYGGRRLVRAAHDLRSESHPGFGLELGPEIYLEEEEGLLLVPRLPGPGLVGPMPYGSFSGYHVREGYFAAFGPAIVAGEVRDLDLQDIPAMTFHILGERIPRRFLHNIPRRLFPTEYFLERPMEFVGGLDSGLRRPGETARPAASDAGIEEQLRALGYVE